jgi:purine-binding chemotaxis protein CheW
MSQEVAGTNMTDNQAAPMVHLEIEGGKFLTFFLDKEEYGLEILKVHEIIGMMPITTVPRTPKYIRGVINLRGKIIPVVDLRMKFGMVAVEQTDESCIIVVQANGVQMGIMVDKVSEVQDITREDIEEAPPFGSNIDTAYILGIGKSQGRVKILLDIDKVLSTKDMVDLHTMSGSDSEAQVA